MDMTADQAVEIIKILYNIEQTGYIAIMFLGGIFGSTIVSSIFRK